MTSGETGQATGPAHGEQLHGATPLVVVTGVSGAGKTLALAALADCGYATVDNPPVRLVRRILDEFAADPAGSVPVAIGLDPRSSGFSADRLTATVQSLRTRRDWRVRVLFLDCADDTILRRFAETRRRHPLDQGMSVAAALAEERVLIQPFREQADVALDTSDLSPHDLRREVHERFRVGAQTRLHISVVSFGFKRGAPREADLMFDARFLANPYWEAELTGKTGLDPDVAAFVMRSPGFDEIAGGFVDLITKSLRFYEREGRSYLTVAIGCTGGKHRSVAVAERLGAAIRHEGYRAIVRHRDMARDTGQTLPPATAVVAS